MAKRTELAGIEYHGIAGVSRDCQDAVMRLLLFREGVEQARIISHSNVHCLLLTNMIGDSIAIKSGFSSGYGGEGPNRFSSTLQFLHSHNVEIDECEVKVDIIERLNNSALTKMDIEIIKTTAPIRPSRWNDYIMEKHYERAQNGTLWGEIKSIMPFSIIDNRIIDLALSFWEGPDDRLLKGYRRLEDTIRQRTNLDEHGARLFSKAFSGPSPHLHWKDIDDGEKVGRTNLFTGAYMAHRNPRGHRELKCTPEELLAEFLVLNHLFRLEKESHYDATCSDAPSPSKINENH